MVNDPLVLESKYSLLPMCLQFSELGEKPVEATSHAKTLGLAGLVRTVVLWGNKINHDRLSHRGFKPN